MCGSLVARGQFCKCIYSAYTVCIHFTPLEGICALNMYIDNIYWCSILPCGVINYDQACETIPWGVILFFYFLEKSQLPIITRSWYRQGAYILLIKSFFFLFLKDPLMRAACKHDCFLKTFWCKNCWL